jgi:hypothetical protein
MGFRPAGSILQLDLRPLDDALPVLLWPRGLIAVAPGGGPRHLQTSSSPPPPLPTTRHFAGLFFVMSFGPSFCRPFFLCHVFWPVVLPAFFSLSCLLARRFAGLLAYTPQVPTLSFLYRKFGEFL